MKTKQTYAMRCLDLDEADECMSYYSDNLEDLKACATATWGDVTFEEHATRKHGVAQSGDPDYETVTGYSVYSETYLRAWIIPITVNFIEPGDKL